MCLNEGCIPSKVYTFASSKRSELDQLAKIGIDAAGRDIDIQRLLEYQKDVIDSGVAVLNMHAPWEAISVADLYETKRGYVSFLQSLILMRDMEKEISNAASVDALVPIEGIKELFLQ